MYMIITINSWPKSFQSKQTLSGLTKGTTVASLQYSGRHLAAVTAQGSVQPKPLFICYYFHPLHEQLSSVSIEVIIDATAIQKLPTNHQQVVA